MDDQDEYRAALSRRKMLGLAAGATLGAAVHAAPGRSAARVNEIVLMDATVLSRAIHSRRISCAEVMNAYLDHIGRFNPKVNAIVALQERQDLLALARERDAQLARGETMGPLHGFPHAVKDLQAVKGIRMTMGSPIMKDFVPAADGLMVERLRAAGAIFIGKTNTPEFGLGSHTYNPVYGVTRNAYDTTRSAGGSSGGAAVSLALRMLPVADGSDYGGSLRNPAGWNGVFGFRTSIGRVPNDARDAWLPSMGVSGPMARNVTDLALLLSVQAGFDARAPLSLEGDGSVFQQRLEKSFKGKRVAWGADFKGHTPCEPGVLEVCKAATRTLESLGCIVEEAVPDFDFEALWQATIRLRGWQQGASILAYYDDPAKRALLKPEAVFEIETGLRQSAQDITAASVVRTDWSQTMRRFFERYDFFIVPTAQVFPFDADQHWPREIAGQKMQTYHEWMKAALLVTMSGCPALAAPAGFNDRGLPIGIQIIAPNRQELSCLQLAYAYESALDEAKRRLPPLLKDG
ncbi:MAG TPA: amidase [Steroidobacteraceae bacterium]|jgi:amidase|nr:amidase [Steroidobacteraceae bacterium]